MCQPTIRQYRRKKSECQRFIPADHNFEIRIRRHLQRRIPFAVKLQRVQKLVLRLAIIEIAQLQPFLFPYLPSASRVP